tara:strand:- start:609 stop:794 length:186 start_codon:yes stop_codon:yes gene_type:complete
MEHNRKTLKIKKSKNKLKPHQWFVKELKKKYDDEKEVSKFGIISKGRKAREDAYKQLLGGM